MIKKALIIITLLFIMTSGISLCTETTVQETTVQETTIANEATSSEITYNPDTQKEVVTAVVIIFGVALVCFVIMEIPVGMVHTLKIKINKRW